MLNTAPNASPPTDMGNIKPDMDCALRLVEEDHISGRRVGQTDGPDPWYSVHDCLKNTRRFVTDNARRQALKRALDAHGGCLHSWKQELCLSNKPRVPVTCMQIAGLALLMGVMCSAKWDSATEKGTLNKSKGGKRAREEDEDDFYVGAEPIPEAAPSPETEFQMMQARIKLRELDVELQREARKTAEAQLELFKAQNGQHGGTASHGAPTAAEQPRKEEAPPAAKPKPSAEPVQAPTKKARDSSHGHPAAAPEAQDLNESYHEKAQKRREKNRQTHGPSGYEPDEYRTHKSVSAAPAVPVVQKQPSKPATQVETPPTSQPASKPQPAAARTQPASARTQPAAARTQPAAARTQPAADQPQPAADQPQPAAARTQPAADQPQPVAARTQPAAAQPQPAAAQPAPPPPTAPQFSTNASVAVADGPASHSLFGLRMPPRGKIPTPAPKVITPRTPEQKAKLEQENTAKAARLGASRCVSSTMPFPQCEMRDNAFAKCDPAPKVVYEDVDQAANDLNDVSE